MTRKEDLLLCRVWTKRMHSLCELGLVLLASQMHGVGFHHYDSTNSRVCCETGLETLQFMAVMLLCTSMYAAVSGVPF